MGCFNEANQTIGLGYKVARLRAVEPRLARMVIEGNDLGIREDAVTMAAILEAGGITQRNDPRWKPLVTEGKSDLIGQLELWEKAIPLLDQGRDLELSALGINLKSLYKAREVRSKLLRELGAEPEGRLISSHREALELAIMESFKGLLFARKGDGWTDGKGSMRVLSSDSVVSSEATFIVGIPWDLDVKEPSQNTAFALFCED